MIALVAFCFICLLMGLCILSGALRKQMNTINEGDDEETAEEAEARLTREYGPLK